MKSNNCIIICNDFKDFNLYFLSSDFCKFAFPYRGPRSYNVCFSFDITQYTRHTIDCVLEYYGVPYNLSAKINKSIEILDYLNCKYSGKSLDITITKTRYIPAQAVTKVTPYSQLLWKYQVDFMSSFSIYRCHKCRILVG